jgi:hypothetical protein
MLDEFDYSLDKEGEKTAKFKLKKLALIISAFFVSLLFLYIIFNAYRFATYRPSVTEVKLIKATAKEIKVLSDSKQKMRVDNIDIKVYDVLNKDGGSLNVAGVKKPIPMEKVILDKVANDSTTETKNDKSNVKKEVSEVAYVRAQIAAVQSRQNATKYWEERKAKYNELLGNKVFFIEEAKLGGKGTFYRLQVGDFKTIEEVRAFCKRYVEVTNGNKIDCIAIEVK